MKRKITTKTTAKGGVVRTLTLGNHAVKIYSASRRVAKGGKHFIYEIFQVADFTEGKRKLMMFYDLPAAVAAAERIAKKLQSGDVMAAQMTSRDAAVFGRLREILRDIPVPLEIVASHFADSYRILGGDYIVEVSKDYAKRNPKKREPHAVAEVIKEMIARKKTRGRGVRYLDDLQSRLDRFNKTFAGNIASITGPEVQQWLDNLKAAPRTVKNFRSCASQLFKFAEARGYISRGSNPVSETELEKVKDSAAIDIYTPSEIARLLAAAPADFKPIIALQAFAGLRSAEVARIEWQDINLAKGHIIVAAHKAKTRSRRLVPITSNLSEWLAQKAKKSGKLWPHTRAYFHEVQRNTSAATRVDADPENNVSTLPPVPWKHNALRHSFISYRLADVQDAAKVALEAGNSPAMIFAHYRELVTLEDAKAWFAVSPSVPANVTSISKGVKAA